MGQIRFANYLMKVCRNEQSTAFSGADWQSCCPGKVVKPGDRSPVILATRAKLVFKK